MKRILFFAALILGVVSCQKDANVLDASANGEASVTLNVSLSEVATRAAGADSAKGGLANVDLSKYDIRYILEVYDKDGNLAKERMVNCSDEDTTSFTLRLIPGRTYSFVVWADFVLNGTQDDLHYDTSNGLKNIAVIDTQWDAIDESRDAYTDVQTIEKFNSSSKVEMKLTRPFAKLRVVTNDIKELFGVLPTEVTVQYYNTNIYNTFNALTKVASGVQTNKELTITLSDDTYTNENPTVNGVQTLFADYLLGAEDDRVMFTFDAEFNNVAEDFPQVAFNTNIPVKRNHLTTIYGPILTDSNNVTVTIDESFEGDFENNVGADSKSVEESLRKNSEVIHIDLTDDVALNGNGVKWGGEDTELIIIDGQNVATRAAAENYTLTFNTTYYLHIETVNPDAKVIFRNLNVTTNKESGTWDIYDIQFNCNVDIENVNFQKAIAFVKADQSVSMKNVTINETHDYYAMWIAAEGQTVNIDGLTINSEGRGIKIDEQYVGAPAKVTLNINGADFNTKKKAAIMVKSAAGADITLSNVDIADVAADTVNAVWVDEDASAYFDKVNVVGGSMAIEGKNTIEGEDAQATFADAVNEANAVVQLAAGEYTIPSSIAEGVTIICQQGTVFNNPSKMNLNGATVIGAKFNSDNSSIVNSGQVNGTFKNCVFEGKNVFRYGYVGKTCVFEDCYFKENGSEWVFHFDGVGTGVTDAEIICRRCTFDGKRVAIAGVVKNLVMEDCTFVNGSYFNTYCNTTITGTSFETSIRPLGNHATYNNCEYYGNALKFEDLKLFTGYDCKVTVDDKDYAVVSQANNFTKYVEEAERDINVYMMAHIFDKVTILQKADVDVFIAGNGKVLRSVYIHGNARHNGAETLTFDNVLFSAFNTRDLISADSTGSVERYAHNVTIQNCSFEGDDGVDVVGLRLRQAYNVTIKDCTTKKLHSLGQITAVNGLTIENVTINGNSGLNLLTSCQNVNIKNTTINATEEDGYGIRMDAGNDNTVNVENSAITAYEPIVFRKASTAFKFNLIGDNTITKNGDYHIVVASGVCPTLTGADDLDIKLP